MHDFIMPPRHHALVAWQRADDLFIKRHQLTRRSFPEFLNATNSAHNFGRLRTRCPQILLKVMAAGCIHAAHRLGYLEDAIVNTLNDEANRVGAPLVGLIRSIRQEKRTGATDE